MPGRSFLGFRVISMLTLAALLLAVASIPSAHAATTVDRFDVSMREYDDTGSLSRPPGARAPTPARSELPAMHYPGASFAPSLDFVVPKGGGRVAWRWGRGQVPETEAELAYEAIRQSKTDVAAISRNTGLKSEKLHQIKNYLFRNPDWTAADPEIATAWHRLRTGAGTETDILLLKHETAEMWLRIRKGLDYLPAHRRANQRWNWQNAVEEGH